MPESFFTDLIDSFTEIIKISPRGINIFAKETIVNLTEFCLTIIRTDSKTISNPYTKAKALELIATFMYADDKKKELTAALGSSEPIKHYFMSTLIQFYVDIEFTGSSSMFYTKFKYRYDCTVIF